MVDGGAVGGENGYLSWENPPLDITEADITKKTQTHTRRSVTIRITFSPDIGRIYHIHTESLEPRLPPESSWLRSDV